MASFNKVILVGNLTRDPELRYTPKGTAIAKIGLAVNRVWKTETGETKEEVTFVDIDAFGQQAETIAQYLKKGRPLLVEGRSGSTSGTTSRPARSAANWAWCWKASSSSTAATAAKVAAEAPRAAPGGCPPPRQPPAATRRARSAAHPKKTTFRFDISWSERRFRSRNTQHATPDFHMAKTEVILTHNIVGLGGESDQVKVAAGYARNYLFPQGLAIPLTGANKRRLEALRQRRAEREAHELNTMTELAKSISKLICLITVKTGEDGKMFGTVTSGMIADQLKTQFDVTLDKRKIHLEQPIRALGDHEVELRLHADVNAPSKCASRARTPPPALPVVPAAEAKKEEPRTEKRGRRPEAAGERPPAGDRKPAMPSKGDRGPRPEKAAERRERSSSSREGPQGLEVGVRPAVFTSP